MIIAFLCTQLWTTGDDCFLFGVGEVSCQSESEGTLLRIHS
jgi:hypothetical protein